MEPKYTDLHALLKSNIKAWQYYNLLPSNIRDQARDASLRIQSFTSLRSYAEDLLRADI